MHQIRHCLKIRCRLNVVYQPESPTRYSLLNTSASTVYTQIVPRLIIQGQGSGRGYRGKSVQAHKLILTQDSELMNSSQAYEILAIPMLMQARITHAHQINGEMEREKLSHYIDLGLLV